MVYQKRIPFSKLCLNLIDSSLGLLLIIIPFHQITFQLGKILLGFKARMVGLRILEIGGKKLGSFHLAFPFHHSYYFLGNSLIGIWY